MQKNIIIPSLLILILYSSCENKFSELDFEKKVMTEIFLNLIDSTCVDLRIISNPPPRYGKYLYDKDGNYIGIDSTKFTNKEKLELLEWQKSILEIKMDTSQIIFAFDPIIKPNPENVKKDFESHFWGSKLIEQSTKKNAKFLFDFKKIKLNNKFVLKNISEFPKNDQIWRRKYDFIFSGTIYFTTIQFDKDKKYGILDAGFLCGRKCGRGFRIFLNNFNGKWAIEKIERTWVS